jgi:hypothetical protein
MFIPDRDFCPSRILDQRNATQERGEKKKCVLPFFEATAITKLKIILFLNGEEKICANIQRLFTKKIFIKLSKI